MKICIKYLDDQKYLTGLMSLSNELKAEVTDDGTPLYAKRGDSLKLWKDAVGIHIEYPTQTAFYRAVGYASFAEFKNEAIAPLEQKPWFDEAGIMIDLSRNGVLTVDALKKYLRLMASFGLNHIYLYTEDTYEIKEYPYFGYMRGRYSANELREIDDYAHMLGIEAIPHIQVLGHMEKYIRWDEALPMRDTSDVILVGEEHTYKFIEDAISTVSSCFRTNKIHLGMDEASDVGTGSYYYKHGLKSKRELMAQHMDRVCEITQKYGLEPIIYGDMFSNIAHGGEATDDIYDKIRSSIPEDFSLVYWDYDSWQYDYYKEKIEEYRKMTDKLIFFGGIWTWFGHSCDTDMTIKSMNPSLKACKDLGIKNVAETIWGNDGAECNIFMTTASLYYFAENVYNYEADNYIERFNFLTDSNWDAFMNMSYFHNDKEECDTEKFYVYRYYGKRYLYADILLGLMDKELEIKPMSNHYRLLSDTFSSYTSSNPLWNDMYEFMTIITDLLSQKCYISERLHKAYMSNDTGFLKIAANDLLPRLSEKFALLADKHRQMWEDSYKSFGFEVLDARYGAMIQRCKVASDKINKYLGGELSSIKELAEPRLMHKCEWYQRNFGYIYTACMGI